MLKKSYFIFVSGTCTPNDNMNENFNCNCTNGLKYNNEPLMTGRDCNTLNSGEVKRHVFNLTSGIITPTRSSVYQTRDGGIYNNPYLRFDSGALEQTLKEPFPDDSKNEHSAFNTFMPRSGISNIVTLYCSSTVKKCLTMTVKLNMENTIMFCCCYCG